MGQQELLMVPVELFDPDPENPQTEDAATFRALVDGIKANGMLVDAVTAVREGDRFRLVAGEHRWSASKLAGLTEIPAVVVSADQWDEDARQAQMLRMNVVRGKFDARKFAQLWTKLEQRYGREGLEKLAGYDGRERDLRALVGDATKALPPKAKAAIEKRKNDIKSPDDLASVVKLVLAETGPVAAKANWIAFSVAGAQHMLVECTQETYIVMRRLAEFCDERGWRPDDALARVAKDWMDEVAASDDVDADEHEHASIAGGEA